MIKTKTDFAFSHDGTAEWDENNLSIIWKVFGNRNSIILRISGPRNSKLIRTPQNKNHILKKSFTNQNSPLGICLSFTKALFWLSLSFNYNLTESAQSARLSCRHIVPDGGLAGTFWLNLCVITTQTANRYHRNSSSRYYNFNCAC